MSTIRYRRSFEGGRLLKLLSAFAAIVLLLVSHASVHARHAEDESLLGPNTSDLAVLARAEDRLTLFVADVNSGDLFYQDVTLSEGVKSWDRRGFQKLVIDGPSPLNPHALATLDSFLYVADKINETIYVIDLKKGVSRLLLKKPEISKPSTIAISVEGLLAIGQDNNRILIYDTRQPTTAPRPLTGNLVAPTRLVFESSQKADRSDLLAFDSAEGRLVLYQPAPNKPDEYSSARVTFGPELKRRLSWSTKTIVDLAYTSDTLYLTNDRQWVAYSREGNLGQLISSFSSTKGLLSTSRFVQLFSSIFSRTSGGEDRWMVLTEMNNLTPRRLVGLDGNLFVLDTAQRKVVRLPLKPVTVRLEVAASEANVLLSDLYDTLARASLLPSRQTIVNEPSDLLALLRKEQVLTPGDFPASPTPLKDTSAAHPAKQLEHVICKLNSTVNGWQCLDEPVGLVQRKFGQGQVVMLPGLGVQRTRFTGPHRLERGETVEAAVKKRMIDETPRSSFSTEYLMRLNRIYSRTLEYEMTRRGYVLTIPSLSTSAASGALVKFAGNDGIVTSVAACQSLWEGADRIQSRPLDRLSETWRLHAMTLEYLPRIATKVTEESILSDWQKRGITRIEMSFDRPIEEVISRESLMNAPPSCWSDPQGKDGLLLWDRISVAGVKYRLVLSDGRPEIPTSEDMVRWGLAGTPDGKDDWSVRVEAPYVLGYRVLPWDGKPLTTSKLTAVGDDLPENGLRVVDPGAARPGSSQDIWAKTNGEFTLPGYRWTLNLLADATNDDVVQSIKQWATKYPGKIYVWDSVSDRVSRPTTLMDANSRGKPSEDFATVIANRKQLWESIALPPGETSAEITIGLMEDHRSVDLLHPDFAWQRVEDEECAALNCFEYVWLVPAQDVSNPIMRMRHIADPEAVRSVRQNDEIDWVINHGTHIAGLLVSNQGEAKGIIPDATIYWIKLGNTDLPDQITAAIESKAEVFNISQAFGDDSFNWLQTQLQLNLKSRLFVVAAGNTGATSSTAIDVNSSTDVPRPLAWAQRSRNIVSVSAVDFARKLLLNPDNTYRVNYGMKYVDMVAPGDNVYSSTQGTSYAPASGTSQAVPLVAGTAALLYRKLVVPDPSVVKARLLYTTEWEDSYLGRVWAGCLNVDRALWGLDRDLFEFEFGDGTETRRRAMSDNSNAKLTIINWNQGAYKSDPTSSTFREGIEGNEKTLPFNQVLRLTRLKNGFYRIIYVERASNRLRIIMDASIEGRIKYRDFEDIVGKTFTHQSSPTVMNLQLNKVIDFVGKVRRLGTEVTF